MTANALEGDRERCLVAGMDDYLAKPVKTAALAAVLTRWARDAAATATEDASGAFVTPPLDAPIDWAVLEGLRELQDANDPDLLQEVIDLFLGDVPQRLTALHDALDQEADDILAREAHTLKGSCANLGARPMADLSRALEARARAGDLAPIPALLERLDVEFGRVRAALSAELARS